MQVAICVNGEAVARSALECGSDVKRLPIAVRLESVGDDAAQVRPASEAGALEALLPGGRVAPCFLEISEGAIYAVLAPPPSCACPPVIPLLGVPARVGPAEHARLAGVMRVTPVGGDTLTRTVPIWLMVTGPSNDQLPARAFVKARRIDSRLEIVSRELRVSFGGVPEGAFEVLAAPNGWFLNDLTRRSR